MLIRFLVDHQGVETKEVFYQAGDIVNLQDAYMVDLLVINGRAELMPADEPKQAVEKIPAKGRRK